MASLKKENHFTPFVVTNDGNWSFSAVLLKHCSTRGTVTDSEPSFRASSQIVRIDNDSNWLFFSPQTAVHICAHQTKIQHSSSSCRFHRLRGRIPERSWPAMPWEANTSDFPQSNKQRRCSNRWPRRTLAHNTQQTARGTQSSGWSPASWPYIFIYFMVRCCIYFM